MRLDLWERFWSKVDDDQKLNTECWPWKGAISKNGYGSFKIDGKAYTSSRVAWMLEHQGEWPDLMVLHTCDNRRCCNPAHLYLGDVKQNSRDMMERGRHKPNPMYGSANHKAKLDEMKVAAIRDRFAQGQTNVEIARRFGVTHQMISKIRRGHFWKQVP